MVSRSQHNERSKAESELLSILGDAVEEEREDEWFEGHTPPRWTLRYRFRCPNGHVSSSYYAGRLDRFPRRCQRCYGPMFFTFPEDFDDPKFGTVDYT